MNGVYIKGGKVGVGTRTEDAGKGWKENGEGKR
jgi:hypothetical protein